MKKKTKKKEVKAEGVKAVQRLDRGGKAKFIQKAIKHPGAMTAAAKREGVSNSKYIEEHKHDSGKAGQRARFAETLSHLRKK